VRDARRSFSKGHPKRVVVSLVNPASRLGDFAMSTPNPVPAAPSPVLVAAAPALKAALTDLKQLLTTVLTGDPLQIGLRVGPALLIFNGQLQLLLPELATAEQGVVLQQATTSIDNLIAKLP